MKLPYYFTLYSFFLLFNCSPVQNLNSGNHVNGVSFVSPSEKINPDLIIIPKKRINANWLCFMPYGFIKNNSTAISFDQDWQWWGERSDGILELIKMAKDSCYQIMLKPHIWIQKGNYTGHLEFQDEEEWINFEQSYEGYILHFAKIAEENKIEIFCIGTEWEKFVEVRQHFWINLIDKVRDIYSGKLTYASNWDEFKTTPFWQKLDYIGINAYFPVSTDRTPSIEEVKENLTPIKNNMLSFSDSLNKQVLFTEYGYRSVDFSGVKPWESKRSDAVNEYAQSNCLEGFYQCFWKEENILGGFLWKWFHNQSKAGGNGNSGYTPQNKNSEKLILKNYFTE